MELVSSQSSLDHEKLVEEIKTDMIDAYGSMYSAFESSLMDESLFKKEWKGKWVDNFIKIAVDNVTPPYVSIGGKFDLVSYDSKGVEKVKSALMKPSAVNENTHLKISTNGSPSYRISIKAPNYKQAEDELKLAVDLVLKTFKADGGIGSFERS